MYHFCKNFILTVAVIIFQLSLARCSVAGSTALSTTSVQAHKVDLNNITRRSTKCLPVNYELKDVIHLRNNGVLLKSGNITLRAGEYKLENGSISACLPIHPRMENLPTLNCSEKFEYEEDEFQLLPNGSAIVGKDVLPPGEYEMDGDFLIACAPEEDKPGTGKITLQRVSIYVGRTGSIISVVSLVVHICTFAFTPSLRNLAGYNLVSLSVAFLLTYTWFLIGQIPQVLGRACVVSAVLHQNFFLAAFFCMSVLAFDVYRMLKSSTERLEAVESRSSRRRQFLCYSVFAWGSPTIITVISIIVDNSKDVPEIIKPGYGNHNICGMDSMIAKAVFFAVPAFSLILVNVCFFLMSSWMISSNAMKVTKDQTKKKATLLNYMLYLRLASMMGLTWLVGVIAIITRSHVVWFVFDLLNSLQGLFLLVFFTCNKRVLKRVLMLSSSFQMSSLRQTTVSSISSSKSDSSRQMKLSQSNSLE